jgi:hypothetical protein
VDHDDVAAARERGEVRGGQEELGAAGGERQSELLPCVPGPVGECGRRAEHSVARRIQLRQQARELARPALDAADLAPRRGAGVDRDARLGQRPARS